MTAPQRLALVACLGASACGGLEPAPACPDSPAREVLERSLRLHDPTGVRGREPLALRWIGLGADDAERYAYDMELGPGGDLALRGRRGEHELEYRVVGDVVRVRVDGSDEIPDETRVALALDRDGGTFWRDYYGFLGELPLCLAYPDVLIEPDVERTELEGRDVLALRARFAPEVGTDVWTFWFEPETAELVGCRFDRADPTRDGETLLFEGTLSVGGLRLPATRRWYRNADRRYLGADVLEPAGGA